MHGMRGERVLMRIHIGESDRWQGKPLEEAIVQLLRARNMWQQMKQDMEQSWQQFAGNAAGKQSRGAKRPQSANLQRSAAQQSIMKTWSPVKRCSRVWSTFARSCGRDASSRS